MIIGGDEQQEDARAALETGIRRRRGRRRGRATGGGEGGAGDDQQKDAHSNVCNTVDKRTVVVVAVAVAQQRLQSLVRLAVRSLKHI